MKAPNDSGDGERLAAWQLPWINNTMRVVFFQRHAGGVRSAMLTIFTTPKPFRGHIGIIQRNALKSWTIP